MSTADEEDSLWYGGIENLDEAEAEGLRQGCWIVLWSAIAAYFLIGITLSIVAAVIDAPGLAVIGWSWPLAMVVVLLGLGALW